MLMRYIECSCRNESLFIVRVESFSARVLSNRSNSVSSSAISSCINSTMRAFNVRYCRAMKEFVEAAITLEYPRYPTTFLGSVNALCNASRASSECIFGIGWLAEFQASGRNGGRPKSVQLAEPLQRGRRLARNPISGPARRPHLRDAKSRSSLRRAFGYIAPKLNLPCFRRNPDPEMGYDEPNLMLWNEQHAQAFFTKATMVVGLGMLIGPLWVLEFVNRPLQRLGVITAFVVLFLFLLSVATTARPIESLAGAAG